MESANANSRLDSKMAVETITAATMHSRHIEKSSEKGADVSPKDLEMQDQSRRRRQRLARHGQFRAVAGWILLVVGFWALCCSRATRHLQEIMYGNGGHYSHAASSSSSSSSSGIGSSVDEAEQCAVDTLQRNYSSLLRGFDAIGVPEFVERRDALARTLDARGVEAFVAEPGFLFEYYTNISQKNWIVDEPQDDPTLLLVIKPVRARDGSLVAKTAFVAPRYEVSRLRKLPVPLAEREADVVIWEEHWDPYVTLRKSRLFPAPAPGGDDFSVLPGSSSSGSRNDSGRFHHHHHGGVGGLRRPPGIMADPSMRSFVANGLRDAGFTLTLGPSVSTVDVVATNKSAAAEVAVLRAVNTASLAAIRAVRACLVPGLTEANVDDMLRRTMSSVGMTPLITSVVLFDANSDANANDGITPSRLTYNSIITVEVAGRYMGHSSDVARTFSVPGPQLSSPVVAVPDSDEYRHAWTVVRAAQDAAAMKARNVTAPTAVIDYAARAVLARGGYGHHRTGVQARCLGLRHRHSSSSRGVESGRVLLPGRSYAHSHGEEKVMMLPPRPGTVLVNAPAVWLSGRERSAVFCLADPYLVTGEGEPELLTGRLAQGLDDP